MVQFVLFINAERRCLTHFSIRARSRPLDCAIRGIHATRLFIHLDAPQEPQGRGVISHLKVEGNTKQFLASVISLRPQPTLLA